MKLIKMKKHIINISLLLTLLLTASLTTPAWADTATVDGVTYTYTISYDKVTLTDASGYGSSITIPSQLGGKDVVVIDEDFLNGKSDIDNVKSITIPATVTLIKDDAFDDGLTSTNELETIVFLGADGAGALTIVDDDSFKEATKVTLDRNLSSESGTGLFAGAETVTIGSHVTKLISNGFDGATSLTSLDLSGATSLVTIDDKAFLHNSLMEVTIPGTVTYIGDDAFDVSSTSNNIKEVVFLPVPEGQENKPLKIVDKANFKSATDIYLARTIDDSASGTTGAGSSLFAAAVNVHIEAGCTTIPSICFKENDNLTSLDFTNASDLTTIAEEAFYGCDGLTKLTFPASLTTIGGNAFYSCDGLLDVNMGNCTKMTAIADETFNECTAINHLILPPNVVTIGKKAFYRNSLTQLNVPATCNLIDEDAFDVQGTNNITLLTLLGSDTAGELTIIDVDNFQSVTSLNLDRHLSSDCSLPVFASLKGASVGTHVKRLNTVPFKGSNIETLNLSLATVLETIDASAFEGCDDLKGVDLSASTLLTSIGEKAFYGCNSIETLLLPASLTTLGKSAFENCSSIAALDLSALEGLTVIPERAFNACHALKSLKLPPNVQTLGKDSFYGNHLSEITIPASCALIDDDALDGVTIEGGLFYNNITKATLQGSAEATPLTINDAATFTNVETLVLDRDLVTEAENTYLFPDVVSLTVSEHVHSIKPYCFCRCHNLKSADFSKATALTTIGKCAFYECTNGDFTTLDLSKCTALTTIGEAAFEDSNDLTTVTFPASLQTIGKWAFYDVPIKTVTIPASVNTIGEDAFGYDLLHVGFDFYTGVKNVTFAGTASAGKLTNKDVDCFDNATYVYLDRDIDTPSGSFGAVESLVIGSHVTSIPDGLFASSNVKTIDATQATALTTIGAKAFSECGSLASIDLSKCKALTTLGTQAFYWCDDLLTCPLPNTLKTIGESAFQLCTSLTTCNLPTGVTSIGKSAFESCSSLIMDCVWPVAIPVVPENVFYDCRSMTSITLPEGITSIGEKAFYYSGLQNIVIPSTVTTIGRSALTVYDGTIATIEFKGADDAAPLFYDDYHCPANTIKIDRDIKIGSAPEGYELGGIFSLAHSLTVGPHTTVLADNMFDKGKVAALNLSSATSLATIGANTFANNSTLTTVTLPASVTTIGTKAFYNCTALKSVDMSAATGLTTIKESTFDECTQLSSLKLPEGLRTIGKAAFYRNSLSEVTIPSTVTVIDDNAFDVMGSSNNIVSVTFSGNKESRGSSLKIIDAANFKSATTIYLDRDISSDSSDKLFASASMVTIGPDVTLLNTKPFGAVQLKNLTMQSIPQVTAGALSSVSANLDLSDASFLSIDAGNLPSFIEARYTRQMSNQWGTVVLPFSVASDSKVQYYALDTVTDDGQVLNLVPLDEVPANTPCFFRRLSSDTQVVMDSNAPYGISPFQSVQATDTKVDDISLLGFYETQVIDPTTSYTDKDLYYIASNKFWYAEKEFTVPAFRAVISREKSTSPASSLSIRVQGDADGIATVNMDELMRDEAVYDLQGRRVLNPEPGIYVVGGRKVMIQ